MEQLYRFVPKCRKLDSYEEAYKDFVCLILDIDTTIAFVEFEDGCKITLPKDEIIEVKFRDKDIWVY